MKTLKTLVSGSILMLFALLTSCHYTEDPGPLQESRRDFSVVDFDRLEMGSAFVIHVEQGDFFDVQARGDVRNIDDLEVYKDGSTLVIRYDDPHYHKHTTYIDIMMPTLRSATFSGASKSTVTGFSTDEEMDFYVSGASVSQLDVSAHELNLVISGASNLILRGSGGHEMNADASGASLLKAFDYWVDEADVNASGASKMSVSVNEHLRAVASGASVIRYRGTPVVNVNTSGASTVRED